MSADNPKASFVGIQLDTEPLLASSIVQTQSDVRMRVVAGNHRQPASAREGSFVPLFKVFGGPREKVCEYQIGVAAIRPEPVEESYERICVAGVGEQIVNFHAIDRA